MKGIGRRDPTWSLILFLIGLVGAIYVYDQLVAGETRGSHRLDDGKASWQRAANSSQQCQPILNGDKQQPFKIES